jgi:hypothetical protein
MRANIKAFLVLVGMAAAFVGAQGYLATAYGNVPLASVGGMFNWLESIVISSAMFVGGISLVVNLLSP